MARALQSRVAVGCLAVVVILAASSTTLAWDGWPYWSGYCGYGYQSQYAQDYVPYFAKHPPVYYSYPVGRPYGYSPFAYPPGYPTPELHAPAPQWVRNQYTSGVSGPNRAEQGDEEEPQPLRIINPYVEQQEGAKEASLPPKPQIVYPAALAKSPRN